MAINQPNISSQNFGHGNCHSRQNIRAPIIVSKQPELLRSESEHLEYSALTGPHRTVSLGNLLNSAAEAGHISSHKSFTKLSDPLNSSEGGETVIFIKSCCFNHESKNNRMTMEDKPKETKELLSESQSKLTNMPHLSKVNTEENYSSIKMHSGSEIMTRTENCFSNKKRQRSKKKRHSSKQRKVGTHDLRQNINGYYYNIGPSN